MLPLPVMLLTGVIDGPLFAMRSWLIGVLQSGASFPFHLLWKAFG